MLQNQQPSLDDFFAQGRLPDGFRLHSAVETDEYSDCDEIDETSYDSSPPSLLSQPRGICFQMTNDLCQTEELIETIVETLRREEHANLIPKGAIEATCGSKVRDTRFLLGDWVFNLSFAYPLNTEVLYQTFALLDRYLSKKSCEHLQLLAACCMWDSAKIELTCSESLDPILQCCHGKYSKLDFISMEAEILNTVEFNMKPNTPNFFIRRFLTVIQAGRQVDFLSSYIAEVSLLFIEFSSMKPSLIAFTSIIIAWILEQNGNLKNLKSQVHYSYDEVRHCATLLINALKKIAHKPVAVNRKFNIKKVGDHTGIDILKRTHFGSGLLLSLASLYGHYSDSTK